jgi:hypothetical protein
VSTRGDPFPAGRKPLLGRQTIDFALDREDFIDPADRFDGERRFAEIGQYEEFYILKRWPAFTRFLDDGRICLSNNAAERALRGIALGRRAWLFAGSDRGGERAAAIYTLIATAKLNGVDPQAWLADVLRRIADHPASQLYQLLPWHWKQRETSAVCRLTIHHHGPGRMVASSDPRRLLLAGHFLGETDVPQALDDGPVVQGRKLRIFVQDPAANFRHGVELRLQPDHLRSCSPRLIEPTHKTQGSREL